MFGSMDETWVKTREHQASTGLTHKKYTSSFKHQLALILWFNRKQL